MTADPTGPADTTMMRIVHDALRRDLARARRALASGPPPDRRQRAAISEQLRWMTGFLEGHHRSEDLGLYPLVRERSAGAAALLDDMAADHRADAPALRSVGTAAAGPGEDVVPDRLVGALDELSAILLPHLRREEDEVMPLVSRVVSAGEWQDIEQEHNLDGKSMAQLGREGHWLIDDTSPEDRDRVLSLVPPIQRLVLRVGFGPAYRRRARACWRPRRRVQHQGSAVVVVDADIRAVWEVVRDPTRVGEWSHECVEGRWVGDDTDARPGARFRGRNRQGPIRWGRLCEVVRVEPYELVWRTVPSTFYPDSTEWAIRLEPAEGGGSRIEETFRVVKGTLLEPVYATMIPAHRDRTAALERDLERIGVVARGSTSPTALPD